jgi:PEP-CTERM motif
MNFKPLFAASLTALAFSPAFAATYDFQTVAEPDGSDILCAGANGDRCSTPDATPLGGTMSFFNGAVSVTAQHYSNSQWNNATVVLDNFSDRPQNSNLKWVGLGAYHQKSGDNFLPNDDNVTSNERLVVTFASAVTLTNVFLRAEGHYKAFAANTAFGVSTNPLYTPGDNQISTYAFENKNSYDLTPMTGTTFVFYGLGGDKAEQYYLSAMTVTAVPEPETYALMLAGLAAVGFVARRRRPQA